MKGHLVNHIQHHELNSDSTLYVVGTIFNPVRYHSRYRLAREWIKQMEATPNVQLCMVEVAFGDRKFEVTESGNPWHLQLRTPHELWVKENSLNVAVRHLLPRDWRYLAWIDCDVTFRDPGWALATIHELQHYPVVQPWSDCVDLGFNGEILQTFKSFCAVHRSRKPKQRHPGEPYQYAHSGFAWACTRAFWEQVGGLMEFPVLGSADHHMAWAMIGDVAASVHGGMTEAFKRRAREWQDAACHLTKGDHVSFIPGRIEHAFHGPKKRRQYRERWQIFVENKFDPDKDLAYDSQGLLYIVNKPKLEADIRQYMRYRNEDSIENY